LRRRVGMHQCRLEHGASGSIVGFGREGLWRRHSPAATRRGPVEKESNVLALSGFEGTFVFSFICHCARTRAGVALSRVGLSPASAAAMACGKEASAIWHVARWRWTLRTRADWMEARSERTSHLNRLVAACKKKNLGRWQSVVHSRLAVIGHRGSLLPRRFGTSESRGVRANLTAGVGRSWSVGLAPLGARVR